MLNKDTFNFYAFRFIHRTYFLLVRVVRESELWISNAVSSGSVKLFFENWLRKLSEDSRIQFRHALSKTGKIRGPPVVWVEKPFSISFSSCRKAHLNKCAIDVKVQIYALCKTDADNDLLWLFWKEASILHGKGYSSSIQSYSR